MKNKLNLTVIALVIVSGFFICTAISSLIGNQAQVDKNTQDIAQQQVDLAESQVRELFQTLRQGVEQLETETLNVFSAAIDSGSSVSEQALADQLFLRYVDIPGSDIYNQIGVAFTQDVRAQHGVFALGLERSNSGYCFSQSNNSAAWGQRPAQILAKTEQPGSNANLVNSYQHNIVFPSGHVFANHINLQTPRITGIYTANPAFKEFINSAGERVTHNKELDSAIATYVTLSSSKKLVGQSKTQNLNQWLSGLRKHTAYVVDWSKLSLEWQNNNQPRSAQLELSDKKICLVRYDDQVNDEDYYDHTKIEPDCSGKTSWYCEGLKTRGWKKAAYGASAKKWLADYSLPLIEPTTKQTLGVAYGNISLMDARDKLSNLALGAKGYAVLIGKAGNILSHPVEAYLTQQVTDTNDERLKAIVQTLGASPDLKCCLDDCEGLTHRQYCGFMNVADSASDYSQANKSYSKLYVGASKIVSPARQAPVSKAGDILDGASQESYIQLIVIVDPSDFEQDNWQLRHDFLQLIIASFVLVCCLLFLILRLFGLNQRRLNWYAAAVSVLAIVALGLTWRVVYVYGADSALATNSSQNEMDNLGLRAACYKLASYGGSKTIENANGLKKLCPKDLTSIVPPEDFVPVFSNEDALAYLSIFNEDGSEYSAQRHRLGMRVFVQSLDFNSANNVTMTGYIWTRFPDSFAGQDVSSLTPVFPEAESVEFSNPISKVDSRGNIHVRWQFATTLRQTFDYRKYPFDREDVWIRIWPNDLHENTVLMPEFSAYSSVRPSDTPGVEEDIVLDGWQLVSSHFSYKKNNYNTALDTVGSGNNAIPELYFNVGLARLFVDPFIADMLPIVVVCLLVFAVLLITTVKAGDIELKGFSSANVLSYCAALYFVLIVSHVHLRETLNAFGIIYLEIFYFCMYFIILIVSANSLAITSEKTPAFIRNNDNYIARLCYFPFITLTLLIATIWMFY
ncbi:hypothetical protein [Saccharophagus degradans]|uniref:Cache domain-containing protein n=1 Tax=Saccharophagus degradans (strain 2-40 / ATCC 43961 / DSM 17024) TaxID=203122 RepID=Q21GL2_SACD2|nr:hypothetical protein [Saccharophagus degradans]ABD82167.1 hypothetical protein Sde_2910 [Saccharophagus degradans 2-40]